MIKQVTSIVVVGGGTSGWMTACYLAKVLTGIKVTLVESPNIPVIGVGEATIPFLRNYMNRIGLENDRLWMKECDATFKTGILFENWHHSGDRYWHPFEYLDYVDRHTHSGHCWLGLHHSGNPAFADKASFYNEFMCTNELNVAHNKVPAYNEYAYHFDAHLFGELLKTVATEVEHVVDEIVDVALNQHGEIEALHTKNNLSLKGDLYIDCTGFSRLLITKAYPGNDYLSYADSLFCDSAVVLRLPYQSEDHKSHEMHPYVKASALSAGWAWTIPLFSKVSAGYVYASHFISDQEAERELRELWGVQRTHGVEPLRLRFSTGKLASLWSKNCVAIGLSGGFIEPLESTGLAITQMGVEMLASMLDARYYNDIIIDRYNQQLNKFYTDIMEFIIAHYCFTDREDTGFWRAVKYNTVIPETLAARLEVFRALLPTSATKGMSEAWMFRDISWFSVLLGMHFPFNNTSAPDNHLLGQAEKIIDEKRQRTAKMMKELPNHYQYLKQGYA